MQDVESIDEALLKRDVEHLQKENEALKQQLEKAKTEPEVLQIPVPRNLSLEYQVLHLADIIIQMIIKEDRKAARRVQRYVEQKFDDLLD